VKAALLAGVGIRQIRWAAAAGPGGRERRDYIQAWPRWVPGDYPRGRAGWCEFLDHDLLRRPPGCMVAVRPVLQPEDGPVQAEQGSDVAPAAPSRSTAVTRRYCAHSSLQCECGRWVMWLP
jgi:hypothetical protein